MLATERVERAFESGMGHSIQRDRYTQTYFTVFFCTRVAIYCKHVVNVFNEMVHKYISTHVC